MFVQFVFLQFLSTGGLVLFNLSNASNEAHWPTVLFKNGVDVQAVVPVA